MTAAQLRRTLPRPIADALATDVVHTSEEPSQVITELLIAHLSEFKARVASSLAVPSNLSRCEESRDG